MDAKTARIRALNDELRRKLTTGTVVMTPGVAALGREAVARIVKTICVFDDFCNTNDPYEEHDFGAFEAGEQTIFFKIDYFDSDLTCYSPDPADPAVTERVLTIMLAEDRSRLERLSRAFSSRSASRSAASPSCSLSTPPTRSSPTFALAQRRPRRVRHHDAADHRWTAATDSNRAA